MEYALEAVKQASAAIGVRSKTHVLLATVKEGSSELLSHQKKLLKIDNHIGTAVAGLTADGRVLARHMRSECVNQNFVCESPLPVGGLVVQVAAKTQICVEAMYSQRHGPEGATTRLVGVKAQPFKVQQGRTYRLPGFEGFCGGSWWDVDVVEQRNKYYLARYLSNSAEEDESWLPLRHLRLRTRKADDWDCHILRRGMDISVFGIHSDHEDLILDPNALYDAKITQLSRAPHDMKCTCRFHVNFFCVREEEDPSGRTLLSRVFATREIDISHVSILQQPVNLTVDEILRSHMFEKWLTIKWCNDAFFLPETKLTVGDDEYDNSTDTLPSFVPTRSADLGVSLRRSRRPTSVLHEKERNAACKGKSRASARDGFDHEHKFDRVNQTIRGLKREGHDLRPDGRGNNEARPDGSEELDDPLDQQGTRTFVTGGADDYDAGRCGLDVGGGGIVYDKSGKEKEKAGTNTSFGREKYQKRFWKMRPGDFDSDRDTKRHDNLETECRGKLGRGDFAESAGKARRVDVEPEVAPQKRAQTSPELVGRVKPGREEVRTRSLRKQQEFSPYQTGRRSGSPQDEQETRKSHRSLIINDTSTEEEDSEYVLGDSAGSDEINVDCQTQWRKRTRYSRIRSDDDDREADLKLSKDGDGGSIRRNTPRKTRRDATHMSEDKHTGAEKSSPSVRRRGRPRKSTKTVTPTQGLEATKVEAGGKKNSLRSPSSQRERKNSASNKHASSQRKARNDEKDAKNTAGKAESSPKTKANLVINLDDEESDEVEDDPPIRPQDLGTEQNRARGLREKQGVEDRNGDKVANQSEGHEGGHEDVILPARLRSQKSEKKKPFTAGSNLPAKHCKVEAEDGGVQRFAQRPLYLDVLDDSTRNETQVECGAVAEEHRSHKPGGDLYSDLGSTKHSVSALEENHAVVDLRDQTVIHLGWVSDADAKMGSASGIEIAGEVVAEPIPMDSLGAIGGETVAEHTTVDGRDTSVHEALTVSDSPDKTRNSLASGGEADAENLKLKVDSQACDSDVAICSDATLEKTLETIQ